MLLKKIDQRVYLFLTMKSAKQIETFPYDDLMHCTGVLEPSDELVNRPSLASTKNFYIDVTVNGSYGEMQEMECKEIDLSNISTRRNKMVILT